MLIDLVGSTELAARFDPEDLREVMGAYQVACAGVIGRFEDTLPSFWATAPRSTSGEEQPHGALLSCDHTICNVWGSRIL
jgi:class 3 adenylate cyclase